MIWRKTWTSGATSEELLQKSGMDTYKNSRGNQLVIILATWLSKDPRLEKPLRATWEQDQAEEIKW